jgi:hypothetical protein
MAAQITGRQLKVGDLVRAARGSPRPDGADRELAAMLGLIVARLPAASSGARGARTPPRGKVRVLWDSGSVAVHDSIMVVKVG